MSIAVAGFLLGLSLIVAIGPQNALVIRQGVKREGLIVVLAICILSDIFLIFGGTAGVGVIIEKAPLALVALKWFGAAYLAWFAVSCFRDMVKPRALDSSATDDGTSLDDAPHGGTCFERGYDQWEWWPGANQDPAHHHHCPDPAGSAVGETRIGGVGVYLAQPERLY